MISHVLAIQEKLGSMSKLAQENLSKRQQQQKLWYDKNARQREFKPGDLVLVLLPTTTSSLTAKWKGPYPVLQKVSSVNYVIDKHDTRKRERTFHVNMMKKWNTPQGNAFWTDECSGDNGDEEDVPAWNDLAEGAPTFGEQLSEEQLAELKKPLG